MKPSMIVYGVPGGKTRFAERIAQFYGLRNGYTFSLQTVCSRDYIYFHSAEFASGMGILVKSFAEVANEINAAIPLTDWRKGQPTIDGEYIASTTGSNFIRSYWREGRWSNFFYEDSSQYFKDRNASIKCQVRYLGRDVEWRGLSEEPINTKE